MKRINKKGFTIVELVIVIAVIGVLAAVLIPTFTKLIRKSRINSDTQLIRNLNTALEADKVETEHKTMESALNAAKAYGYDISKINASATNNEILWDSQNDVFCYYNEGELEYLPDSVDADKKLKANSFKLWKIYSAAPKAGDNYSIYVASQAAADYVNSNDVNVGVDCGSYVVENVSYKNTGAKLDGDVVIRTNGGNLTINAKNDNVIHYGYADSVNVVDVATASYHENGTVKFLEVAAGHIVLEQASEVSAVHFTATGEGDAAKFENADGKKISIDLSNARTESISFSRDPVTIADNGTYVAEVKIESTEYIWLFGNGIKEQMVVTDTTAPIAENGTLKTGVVAGAEDGSVADQIANPAKRNGQGQLVDNNDEVIDLTEVDLTKANGLDEVDVVVEEVADKASVQIGATLFAGGSGSATDPFLVVDYDTFQHISDLYEEGYYYFKVKDGIASISLQDNKNVSLNGSFNGNGVKFTNVNAGIFGVVGSKTATSKEVLLENFNVDFVGGEGIVRSCGTPDLTFKNIDVTGYMLTEWNAGLFLRYGTANVSDGFDYTVSFDDCSSRAEVYSSTNAFSAILIGHGYQGANNTLTINLDSDTDNNINSTVLYFTGKGTPYGNKYYCMTSGDVVVNIDGVEQYRGGYAGFTANKMTGSNVVAIVANKNPSKTSEGAYQLTPEADASKVVVSINWQYTEWEKDYTAKIADLAGVGGTFSDKIVFEVKGNDPIKLLDKITAVEIRLGQEKWGYEIVNGKIILNMTNTNSYIDGHVTLIVEQFTGASNIAKYRGSFELATKDKGNDWIIK